ncbi:similar to Saccharomyces cerevisiae YGR147C NAT2 Protein with an apparent role in acetylation of N-terminal methionine residues [Maudiozyma barnettii]|uniref:Similar to Saccharomyces cerevisiae YGR147C NAT2 Protein with an apparent role in acetylation of N-terminal methionine residues n=1 Tax=Maudiozyma barnettii TaxID=61262 RepID=A0A8H2ZKD5_9SACH|nr:Nat2p [Kazachstania barnettii]CAB4255082.1 similar to Saccharomyces cerevisiae YGR147C NAT2 Protein with an apparent role in acetylation of N-terminal methionine residues [Kazachstania barnettii]CAD1783353.1 similar to Saccharomyces cerevisiae YGR147C NAT2 Protein with an apparent role in acetylation of N-terminal methionine residues [Kazachstania barnettii]
MLRLGRIPIVGYKPLISVIQTTKTLKFPTITRSISQSCKRLATAPIQQQAKNVKAETGIKKLMKKYGYSALVVYIGVTFISLPLCFFTVHSMGAEKISIYMNRGKQLFGYGEVNDEAVIEKLKQKKLELEKQRESGTHTKWGEFKQSTLLAEFLIAYGLHKSLVFVRIPVTAAVTPTMARLFQRWGFRRLAGGANIIKNDRIIPKVGPNGELPRQNPSSSRKWFNGLM